MSMQYLVCRGQRGAITTVLVGRAYITVWPERDLVGDLLIVGSTPRWLSENVAALGQAGALAGGPYPTYQDAVAALEHHRIRP